MSKPFWRGPPWSITYLTQVSASTPSKTREIEQKRISVRDPKTRRIFFKLCMQGRMDSSNIPPNFQRPTPSKPRDTEPDTQTDRQTNRTTCTLFRLGLTAGRKKVLIRPNTVKIGVFYLRAPVACYQDFIDNELHYYACITPPPHQWRPSSISELPVIQWIMDRRDACWVTVAIE